jgi:hypothetical protein
MRKFLFVLIIYFLSNFFVNAQHFNGGIIAGISASQVSGDNLSGFDKAGVFGGVFANLQISEKSVFQIEIDYIEKGSKQNPKEKNGFYSYILKLKYVEVPLLYKYIYSDKLSFELGPYCAILIKDAFEEQNEVIVDDRAFNKQDIGITVGIAYSITPNLKINMRNSNTFFVFPVREHLSGAKKWYNQGQYNTVLTFSIQYQFKN